MLYDMRRYEATTIFLLLIGGVILPVVGWLLGAVMLVMSGRWSMRDKLIGLLVWPGGLALTVGLIIFAPTQSCVYVEDSGGNRHGGECTGGTIPAWLGVPLLILTIAGPILTAVYLTARARRRT